MDSKLKKGLKAVIKSSVQENLDDQNIKSGDIKICQIEQCCDEHEEKLHTSLRKSSEKMSAKFKFDLPKEWNWHSIFVFPETPLGRMMKEIDLTPTEEMLFYDPIDEEMIKFEQRMIYYSKDK